MENSADLFRTLVFAGIVVAALLIFVLFCVVLNLWAKRRDNRREAERAAKLAQGVTARARIFDRRRAGVQRSDDFTLFRVLLEIFPADSPPFSTAVVWEIEPPALAAIEPGVVLPVRFHQNNMREIHPELAGARYSDEYQHAHLGIENDLPPVQNLSAAGQIAPPAPKENTIYRRRSRIRVFGLPLWEVAFNLIRKKGNTQYAPRNAKARAVFAVGDSATGIVAIGSFARGIVAVGQFGIGLVTFGTGGVGVVSIGIMSFGLLTFGAIAAGLISFGAISAGLVTVGFLTISRYAFSLDGRSGELMPFYNILKNASGLNDAGMRMIVEYGLTATVIISFAFFFLWMIANAVLVKYLEPNDNRLDSPRR